MRAAHDHADASRPEAHGKVISVISAGCVKGNGDDIDFNIAVDGFGLFVDVNYVPTWRNPGGQIRHGDLLKVEDARSAHRANFRGGSGDQQKSWHNRGCNCNRNIRHVEVTISTPPAGNAGRSIRFLLRSAAKRLRTCLRQKGSAFSRTLTPGSRPELLCLRPLRGSRRDTHSMVHRVRKAGRITVNAA